VRGYTAKVGLRKSRTHFVMIQVKRIPRDFVSAGWVDEVLSQMRGESLTGDHHTVNAFTGDFIGCGRCGYDRATCYCAEVDALPIASVVCTGPSSPPRRKIRNPRTAFF